MSSIYAQRIADVPLATRIAGLACGALLMRWLWVAGHIANGPILCPFRLLTGHPCPMCGSTRAVAALCAGDVNTAWHLNPLGTTLAVAVGVGFLNPTWIFVARSRIQGRTGQVTRLVTIALGVVSFAAVWIWNFGRW